MNGVFHLQTYLCCMILLFNWIRFEAGTPAIGEAIGLGAAIDYLTGLGMQKIHDYEVRILKWLLSFICG